MPAFFRLLHPFTFVPVDNLPDDLKTHPLFANRIMREMKKKEVATIGFKSRPLPLGSTSSWSL
jgi:hypothetical protein